ncbi:hypothetical protein [Paraliobacillus sp. X-1268]|uniref:hypothetical protein n=1 Tax=Paraliobacillus sp. X-1268 TaxID=2213193 RepID=UPI000E3B7A37|nr:hypothetical protein [Paraliobacillus sp. X-1268]
MSGIFNSQIFKIDHTSEIHFIDIKEIDETMSSFINQHFVRICKGVNSRSSIEIVKKTAKKFFDSKDYNKRIGGTAEFFIHLYLLSLSFEQQCMFLNKEENAMKKGFDGYYTIGEDEWIMESKAGNSIDGSLHKSKIKEAYRSLSNQLKGVNKDKNDPWQNAFQHANSRDNEPTESLLRNLELLSDDYVSEIYHLPEEFNIIPASTIFFKGEWNDVDRQVILDDIKKYLLKIEFSRMLIICCSKRTIDLFMDFLDVIERNEDNGKQRENTIEINQ